MRMHLRKLTAALAMGLAFMAAPAQAQYYYYNDRYLDNDLVFEVGGAVGVMNALTDLGTGGFSTKGMKLNGGLYAGAMYKNLVAARLEMNWGKLEAFDSTAAKGSTQQKRNLNFRTNITEISLIGEFHPLMLRYLNKMEEMPAYSPYLLAGYTWMMFDPRAVLNGKEIPLQPLRTEGQGFPNVKSTLQPYNLGQSVLNLGLGLKYELGPRINLRGEFNYRVLFTDYLDDVSGTYIDPALFDANLSPEQAQFARILFDRRGELDPAALPQTGLARGNSGKNDAYWGVSLRVGIVLGRGAYH